MAFRTGTPQWMKLNLVNIREKERRRKEEEELIRIAKLKMEKIRRESIKKRNQLGYWKNINGWRFIRWSEQRKI